MKGRPDKPAKCTQINLTSDKIRILGAYNSYDTDPKPIPWTSAEFRQNRIMQSPHENYFNVCPQHKEK